MEGMAVNIIDEDRIPRGSWRVAGLCNGQCAPDRRGFEGDRQDASLITDPNGLPGGARL